MNASLEPTRHRLSIEDYERLGEAGILPPDSRVELIDGELIDMAPIGTGHASTTTRLIRLLVTRAADRAIVSPGNPMRLPPWSMPQPDLMLLRPRRDEYATCHPDADDVLLAIEVAESSLRFDLGKGGLSARGLHKVQKAWIEHEVPQCGYCQTGMIMSAVALLEKKPRPTDADIDDAMTNLCRCGTYARVRKAIHAAAAPTAIVKPKA